MIGKTLSHYRIDGELGRGGMGVVYKAFDTQLDRDVAIKVLPASALASEDDRARFYREAKAAAQLHHPHIAGVFQIDEAIPLDVSGQETHSSEGALPFIAMEFIDGEPLESRIKRGPLKLDEAIRIASEIADALKAAHAKNIVHRDIKSANVMLTAEGSAKVLDFGLAKTSQSTKLTRMGSTLGTVAYMSPEQARGEEVDHRADLWSLGIVIFEMIAGRLPFATEYEQAAVYSILNEDPEPLTAVRTGVPMELEYTVNKLLSKDARHRFQSAADVMADLSAMREQGRSRLPSGSGIPSSRAGSMSRVSQPIAERHPPKPDRQVSLPILAATGLIVVLGLALSWALTRDGQPAATIDAPVMRLSIDLPPQYPLSFFGGSVLGIEYPALDLTRDGKKMVFVSDSSGTSRLVLRDMRTGTYRVLQGTEDAYHPVFSPDGDWVAFISSSSIMRVPTGAGGAELVTSVSDPDGMIWSTDGWIYFLDRQGLVLNRTRPSGQEATVELLIDPCRCRLLSGNLESPEFFVGGISGQSVFSYVPGQDLQDTGIVGSQATILPSGPVIFTRSGRIRAANLNREKRTISGDSRSVIENLRTGTIVGAGQFTVSNTGTLVYAAGDPADITRLVVRELDGSLTPLPFDPMAYGAMDVSQDEQLITVQLYDGSGRLLVLDLARGTSQVLAQDVDIRNPTWSPDGRSVAYGVTRGDSSLLLLKQANSDNAAITLASVLGSVSASDWSTDGRFLLYASGEGGYENITALDMSDSSEVSVGTSDGTRMWGATFSGQDRFIAYTRVGPAGSEVIVEPFPKTGERWNISAGVGEEPEWLNDRNEILFRRGQEWYTVAYRTSPSFSYEAPQKYFDGPFVNILGMEYRGLSGGRVLLQEPLNTDRTTSTLQVVVNWAREVAELLPAQE